MNLSKSLEIKCEKESYRLLTCVGLQGAGGGDETWKRYLHGAGGGDEPSMALAAEAVEETLPVVAAMEEARRGMWRR
jgi:hypothetical protein